jgi:hypothetical protein
MMKHKILICLILFFVCSSFINDDRDPLAHINHINTLKLVYKNKKCGEWGGDRETITIYRKEFKGEMYADYLIEIRDCSDPYSEDKKERKNGIKISDDDKKLILDSVKQLAEGILSRENYPAHSGYYSEVMMKDSSVVLNDFPSIRWTKFEELSKKLTVANHKK